MKGIGKAGNVGNTRTKDPKTSVFGCNESTTIPCSFLIALLGETLINELYVTLLADRRLMTFFFFFFFLLGFLTGRLRRGRPSCYARLGPSHICVEGRKVESPHVACGPYEVIG